jgi:outer membrane protein W
VRRFTWLIICLGIAAPASAQGISIRPFAMVTEQSFAAVDTFDATFDKSYFPFFGGGVQVLFNDRFFAELSASRFRQAFKLGVPLAATIIPFELTGGYRFRLPNLPRVRPYVAAGVGSYSYKETSSFADAGDDVDTRHVGFVANGGAEFRLHNWVGLGVDVQYSHVAGILGSGGVSQQAGESDLGGVAARVKVIVGR